MEFTPRQREILTRMRDQNEELVYECGGEAWIGDDRTSAAVVFALLRLMAIRMDRYSCVGEVERYTINETGKKLLAEVVK